MSRRPFQGYCAAYLLIAVQMSACGGSVEERIDRPPARTRSSMEFRLVVAADAQESGTFELLDRSFAMASEAVVTERDIIGVWLSKGDFNQPMIKLQLAKGAGARFGEFTQSHLGRDLAIVVDGQVFSMTRINDEVRSEVVIEPLPPSLTPDDARKIAEGLAP